MTTLGVVQFILILVAGYGIAVLASWVDDVQERRSGR